MMILVIMTILLTSNGCLVGVGGGVVLVTASTVVVGAVHEQLNGYKEYNEMKKELEEEAKAIDYIQ